MTPSPAIRVRLVFAGKALVLASLLAAVGLLVLRAERHRRTDRRHVVDLAVWSVAESPSWATVDDVVALRDAAGVSGRGLPLYDRGAAEALRAAIERAPWTRRVVSLRRVPPDCVEVVLEMRRPVAAIAVPGGYVEVDRDGVVLAGPTPARPTRGGRPLRVVTGAVDAATAAGETGAADVRAGVDLAVLLDAHDATHGTASLAVFDEVDVTNHAGRDHPAESEIVLRAAPPPDGGPRPTPCVVEWGRLDTRFGEPPFDAKAARLARAVSVFGDFEGVARVRVAFETVSVLPVDGPAGAWLPALAEQTLGR